jgi:hypothetical protein
MITWIAGDFVEADNPNQNKQFWTAADLALSEYTIKYAPLNMVHKVRQPVGFFAATRTVDLTASADEADDAEPKGTAKIQALSGLWSHVFPFEAALVDSADESGNLYYSMECRGTHLHCAGPNGCDETFEYADYESHCDHLTERTSVRHIVNPTFRGGALIIPPVQPGWKNATASVYQTAVLQEAAFLAEQTEAAFDLASTENPDLTPYAWEHLMAGIVALASAE